MAKSQNNIEEQEGNVTLDNSGTNGSTLEGRTLADQAAILQRENDALFTEETPPHIKEAELARKAEIARQQAYNAQQEREEKQDNKDTKSRQAGDDFELVSEIAEAHNEIKALETERANISEEATSEILTQVEKALGRPLTEDEEADFAGVAKSVFEQSADSMTCQFSYGEETDKLLDSLDPEVRSIIIFEAETIAAKGLFGTGAPNERSLGQEYRQKGGEMDTLEDHIEKLKSGGETEHIRIADIEQQTEGVVTEELDHLTLERTTRPEYLHQTAMEMVAYYKASGLSMSGFKSDMEMLDISEAEQEAILKVFDKQGFKIKPDAPAPNQSPQLAQSTRQPEPQREIELNNTLNPTVGFS